MHIEDCSFMISAAVEFYSYFRVEGWFFCASDKLVDVSLQGKRIYYERRAVGTPHPGVEKDFGPNMGFHVYAMLDETESNANLTLVFHTLRGRKIRASITELCDERKRGFGGREIVHRFLDTVNADPSTRLLDLGGRSRSGADLSKLFHNAKCTVFDVLPGENVDVVGDAHAMSLLFPPNSFDAIFSTSVFEHLLMPWVVAAEMSRILRLGGTAFIATHQTMGMHDRPWDFWRFSDTAWDGIFNHLTGFEILDRALENPQYIVPYFLSPEQVTGRKIRLALLVPRCWFVKSANRK
jgi:hypothetical protein